MTSTFFSLSLRLGGGLAIGLLAGGCDTPATPVAGPDGRASAVSNPGEAEPRPRLVIEPRDIILTDLPADQLVAERTVRLTNRGDGPLTIREVHKSCTCTDAGLDRSVIPPGEGTAEGVVRLNVRTAEATDLIEVPIRLWQPATTVGEPRGDADPTDDR